MSSLTEWKIKESIRMIGKTWVCRYRFGAVTVNEFAKDGKLWDCDFTLPGPDEYDKPEWEDRICRLLGYLPFEFESDKYRVGMFADGRLAVIPIMYRSYDPFAIEEWRTEDLSLPLEYQVLEPGRKIPQEKED